MRHAFFESEGQAPVEVVLPHRITGDARFRSASYTVPLTVTPDTESRVLGLCISRWSLTADVWLDKIKLADAAPGITAVLDYTRPHFVAVPAKLESGEHQLTVKLSVLAEMDPGLSDIWWGDGDQIGRACQGFADSKRVGALGATFMMILAGLVSFSFWVLTRDSSALYFSLVALAWSIHYAHLTMVWWPDMPLNVWSYLYFASRVAFLPPMLIFCLRISRTVRPRLERGVWLVAGAALLILSVLPAYMRAQWISVMGILGLLSVTYFFGILLRSVLRERNLAGDVLLLSILFVFISHVLDLMRWIGFVPYGTVSLSYFSIPLLFASFGVLLGEHMVRYVWQERQAKEWLQKEVEQSRRIIQSDFDKLQLQRDQLAIQEERQRIVRDMHDGLGSQLVTARALLMAAPSQEKSQVEHLITGALLELRCVLDVLAIQPSEHPQDSPVSTLMGTLRWRIEPALKAIGCTLVWRVQRLPKDFLADDHSRLQLLRLLQEAFSNVIKHSGATRVEFNVQHLARSIVLTLSDNGRGLSPARPVGYGIQNMRTRADELGAQFEFTGVDEGGCLLRLQWFL